MAKSKKHKTKGGKEVTTSFDVRREEAVRSIQERDPDKRTSWHWSEVWQEEHENAFVIAKMVRGDLLKEVHDSLERAIANGTPFEKWKKEIVPKLQGEWIGKTVGELWDELPESEKKGRQAPDPDQRDEVITESRLKTIYNVNMAVANARERYKRLEERKDNVPYWQYISMNDQRARASHKSGHKLIFRHDDVFWETHYPPNGWNCRCYVIGVTERMIEESKNTDKPLQVMKGEGHIHWETDSRTGKKFAVYFDGVHRVACDPGWSYCVGRENRLKQTAAEKEKSYSPKLKAQADKAEAEHNNKKEQPKDERTNEISEAAEAIEKAITETQKQATDAAKKIAPIAKKAEDLRKAYEYQEKALGIKCVGVQETDRNQAITAASSASEAAKKAEDSRKKAEEAQKQLADLKLKASKAKENGSVQETLDVLQRVRELKADCEKAQNATEAFAQEAENCQKLLQSALASTASLNHHIQPDYSNGVRYASLYDKTVQAEHRLIEKELLEGEALITWDESSRLAFKVRAEEILEASKANSKACQALGANNYETAAMAKDGLDLLIQMRNLRYEVFKEKLSHLPKDEQTKERRKRRENLLHRLSIANSHLGILCKDKSNPTAEERKKEQLMLKELRLALYNFTPDDIAVFDKYYAKYAKSNDYLFIPTSEHKSSYYSKTDVKCYVEFEQHYPNSLIYKAPYGTIGTYRPYFDWNTKIHEESHHLDHIAGVSLFDKPTDPQSYRSFTFPKEENDLNTEGAKEGKEATIYLKCIEEDIIRQLNSSLMRQIETLEKEILQLKSQKEAEFSTAIFDDIRVKEGKIKSIKNKIIHSIYSLNNWERKTRGIGKFERETSEIKDENIKSLAETLMKFGKTEKQPDGTYKIDFRRAGEIFDMLGLTSHGSYEQYGYDRLKEQFIQLYQEHFNIKVSDFYSLKHLENYDSQDKGHADRCDETSELWAEFNAARLTADPDLLRADRELLSTSFNKFLDLWHSVTTKFMDDSFIF
ncbi:MAG: minor capsid protein [bacterium]|nr:minor capsid protein [bacterium]